MLTIEVIKVLVTLSLYLALFAFFCHFYLIEQMTDYFKRNKIVSSRIEEVKVLEPPTFTICIDPPFKTSVAEKYGYDDQMDVFKKDVPNITYAERFTSLSYILEEDYDIYLSLNTSIHNSYHSEHKVKLENGTNMVDGKNYSVTPIMTWAHGICSKVQPEFQITKVPFHTHLFLEPKGTLQEKDKPRKFIIYMTSNNTWQNIVNHIWPQYNPSILFINPNSSYYMIAKKTEYQFDEGVESTEDCWMKHMEYFHNCVPKCRYATFMDPRDMPLCNTSKEIQCIMEEGAKDLVYTICNKKRKGFTFTEEIEEIERYNKDFNWTEIDIELWSMSKMVKEEVDVITLPELIGSVGGSMGMFFGFSIATFIWYWKRKCIEKIVNQSIK